MFSNLKQMEAKQREPKNAASRQQTSSCFYFSDGEDISLAYAYTFSPYSPMGLVIAITSRVEAGKRFFTNGEE